MSRWHPISYAFPKFKCFGYVKCHAHVTGFNVPLKVVNQFQETRAYFGELRRAGNGDQKGMRAIFNGKSKISSGNFLCEGKKREGNLQFQIDDLLCCALFSVVN